jgi:putative ABC transport system permease protein
MSPVLIAGAALWVAVLSMLNVRERRHEIGLMRALGEGTFRIAALFQGKAMLVGFAGGAAGAGFGSWLAVQAGPRIFKIAEVKSDFPLVLTIAMIAILFSALASFVPSMIAATQDPAEILKNE